MEKMPIERDVFLAQIWNTQFFGKSDSHGKRAPKLPISVLALGTFNNESAHNVEHMHTEQLRNLSAKQNKTKIIEQ